MTRIRSLLFSLALVCPLLGAAATGPRVVSVAVAANMKPAFEEIMARFKAQDPGVEVKVTYGASGNFFAQIANGAPLDLFLSADAEYPAKVVEKGLADGKAFSYAYGKLVLWVPKASKLDLAGKGLSVLLDPSVKRIALGDPAVAPYGRAAKEALEKAGLWRQVEGRVVLGQSVSQAAQFVQSGNAQAGFVPLSLAKTKPLAEEGRYWLIPSSSHGQIEQAAVVLKNAAQPESARKLAAFVESEAAREILVKYGYDLPVR